MYDVYIVWVESLTDAKSSAGRIDHQKAKRREHNHYTREGSTEARVGKCLRRRWSQDIVYTLPLTTDS